METDQAERLAATTPEAAAIIEGAAAQKPARRLIARSPAARGGSASRRCLLPELRWRTAADRRGCRRDARLRAGPLQGVRHIREKLSCRACDTVVAGPAPDHAIGRGRAGAGLLAHIVVSKYDDHLPLYRQAEIYAREGVCLETSTLCGWVGATAVALAPLVDALAAEVTASDTLHVDDTPVPVLAF